MFLSDLWWYWRRLKNSLTKISDKDNKENYTHVNNLGLHDSKPPQLFADPNISMYGKSQLFFKFPSYLFPNSHVRSRHFYNFLFCFIFTVFQNMVCFFIVYHIQNLVFDSCQLFMTVFDLCLYNLLMWLHRHHMQFPVYHCHYSLVLSFIFLFSQTLTFTI